MKFSEQWLRQWVNPALSTEQLAEQLTLAGLEVETVTPAASAFQQVKIAEVVEVKPHPDAERLKVCQVSLGAEPFLTIVCGAPNVRVGLKAPLAGVGAVLPGDIKIEKARLRGIESQGMLCSMSELGLAEETKGLMELPEDAPVGMDLREYLQLDDFILDVVITPNRADCLSIMGLAREVAALNRCPAKAAETPTSKPVIQDELPIKILAPAACPHYVGRVIRDINPHAKTPLWLQEKLRRSGLRSIHPVVDVANYVMLELGQPLHAFDLKRLEGAIQVRFAAAGETITLLNGELFPLDENILVIADDKGPQAIAGIMGGMDSGVSALTTHIFLESAFFSPLVIANTLRQRRLTSDAAYRFERGVDYQLQAAAIERATALLLEVCGGRPGPLTTSSAASALPQRLPIQLRRARIQRVLGVALANDEVVSILQRLGMGVTSHAEGWQVAVPSYRFDLTLETDLIEELARLHGYDQLPATLPQAPLRVVPVVEEQIPLSQVRALLVARDYHEVITYSFVAPDLQTALDPQQQGIVLTNPISSELAVMRTQLWPGLIQVAQYNQARQQTRVRIFETGLCFTQADDRIQQGVKLSGLVMGNAYPEQWGVPRCAVDFFDVKGDLAALFQLTKQPKAWRFVPAQHPALHPGQSAAIWLADRPVGYIGALHPNQQQALDLPDSVFLFEVELTAIQGAQLTRYRALSKFPAIRRDLAVVVDQAVPFQEIYEKITATATELLQQIQLFDIYHGKGIGAGEKSLALGLTFQHESRTLVDAEINEAVQRIVATLQHELSARLRE